MAPDAHMNEHKLTTKRPQCLSRRILENVNERFGSHVSVEMSCRRRQPKRVVRVTQEKEKSRGGFLLVLSVEIGYLVHSLAFTIQVYS